MKKILAVFVALMFALSISAVASACNVPTPSITLSPPQGFAMTMVTGTGFDSWETLTILYDGAPQPTIPQTVTTDQTGSFSAIFSIPNELAVGTHTVIVTDTLGNSASATFTVVDMTGSQGPQGPQGGQGVQGPQGIAGQNGEGFNATGNILLYNGTDGTNGINGLNFNATGNVLVYNGTNGLNGINGLNGLNGIDGTNGINGVNGINGKDGTNGAQGAPGVAGQEVYVDPPPMAGVNPYYIATLIIALIALTATMLAISSKSKNPS
jgi:hypothetical protein